MQDERREIRAKGERRLPDVIAALEENVAVFEPLVDGLCDAVRRGGRVLLFGEGRLHLLASHAAAEIVGRRHKNGAQLPTDALDATSGDPQAIARRVGPFDAILAVASTCEDELFAGALEAARARGAKVFCLCLGRARVEGKVTLAVDIPEGRPHYVPGHVGLALHFIAKLMLGKMAANPLIKPTRLDDGPPRLARSGSGQHPSYAQAKAAEAEAPRKRGKSGKREAPPISAISPAEEETARPRPSPASPAEEPAARAAPPAGDWMDASELLLDLEPDEAEMKLVEANADAAAEVAGSRLILEEPGKLMPPPVPADEAGRVRLLQFRCKECREPILADPGEAGNRARCPFCGKRIRVPQGPGRLYQPTQATLSQTSRSVSLRFSLDECTLEIGLAGGAASIAARVEEVTADGIEASLAAADARALALGAEVELRIEAPAFLEPLVMPAVVERIFAPATADASARARALLPLHASAGREARAKLARLAELRQGPQG